MAPTVVRALAFVEEQTGAVTPREGHCAHPNERALSISLKHDTSPDRIQWAVRYLTDDPIVVRVGLKTAAQVGASVLGMLRLVFRERFDLTDLSAGLDRARQEL